MTSAELKAIGWYAQEHNYRVQLSSMPLVWFKRKDKKDDTPIKINITVITNEYNVWKKEDQKTRARLRRIEKEKENGKRQQTTFA